MLYETGFLSESLFAIQHAHIAGVLLVDLFAGFIAYTAYQNALRRQNRFLACTTLAYGGFTLLYTVYSGALLLLEPFPFSFLIFAPVARIILSCYLLLGLFYLKDRNNLTLFHWKKHCIVLIILTAILLTFAASCTFSVTLLRQGLELLALVISFTATIRLYLMPKKATVLTYHLWAQFIFTQSSFAFLIGYPWNLSWWIGQLLVLTGFIMMGFAILQNYAAVGSLKRVYDPNLLEHLMDQIIDSSPVGILLVDSELEIIRRNAASEEMLAWAQPDCNIAELLQTLQINLTELNISSQQDTCLFASLTKQVGKNEQSLDAKVCRLDDPTIDGYLITLIDMTTYYKAQQKINYLAKHDTLTDLPNRTEFLEKLAEELTEVQKNNQLLAVMFIDLDGFKQINDTLGHSIGDFVLKIIATRLRQSFKARDTIARLGGDEFTAIVPGISTWLDAGTIAERILIALEKPVVLEGQSFFLSASIGISLYPLHGATVEDLITKADQAMYQIKKHGKNGYIFADVEIKSD
ncbi:MAG: sensor domain-containing diguanylate cyclase [Sporomusaceae bacterium]|nr:sensor domain-containing diguanylate cyclase [Sporomusaceae bacterium]